MVDPKVAMTALGAILVSIMGAWVIGAIPDPYRETVNAIPNTDPNIKAATNTVLDVKDTADTLQDTREMTKNLSILLLAIGIPAGIASGLLFGRRG